MSTISIWKHGFVTLRPATYLSQNAVKRQRNMKKRKVCRECLAHFTEHLLHISYFTSFRSRWRFFDETSKVSYRVLRKSSLICSLESKFHGNGEKCVKECFRFHLLFCETHWNNIKYEIWYVCSPHNGIFSIEVKKWMCFVLVLITMCDKKHEQRINMKFFIKLKEIPAKCYKLLKETYGENSLSCTCVFEWYKQFSEGWKSTEVRQLYV